MHQKASHQPIESLVLESTSGMRVNILNLGATIQSIQVPTNDGLVNTVLGFENYEDYRSDTSFLGATVGRFANRIQDARFEMDGQTYLLDADELTGGHCLHSGASGFHRQFFTLDRGSERNSIECLYDSPDGEGGFPGNLKVSVNYQIVNGNMLVLDYRATTDRDTVVSLANHVYFNLDQQLRTIDNHYVSIDADRYTPIDAAGIPSGELRDVAASDFDLRQSRRLCAGSKVLQFDHNFVLSESAGVMRKAAALYSPNSGLCVRIHTTQPGLQLYTGHHLADPFQPRQGLCLETQSFPDAPNQAVFPSARLAVGETYHETTVFEFHPEAPYL